MAKLIFSLRFLSIAMLLPWATLANEMKEEEQKPFDGVHYLCAADEQHLLSYDDVIAFNDFMEKVRYSAISPDLSNCPSSRYNSMMTIIGIEDGDQLLSSIIAFAGHWVTLAQDANSFEERYSLDSELLLQLSMLCDAIGESRDFCVAGIIGTLPEQFLSESPVFCDLAANAENNIEASENTPNQVVLQNLPFICGGVLGKKQTAENWSASLEHSLFPPPMQSNNP